MINTWFNIPPQYHDVVVPVSARLFVKESQSVHYLVHYCALIFTSFTDGDSLLSTLTTNG